MLAPNPETILNQLNADYAVNRVLMGWSHTLLNTSLFTVTPKPKWFDRIAGELKKAKEATEPWLFEEYPDIAAALPQSLIDYGNLVLPTLEALGKELAKRPLDRRAVLQLIEGLAEEAGDQRQQVAKLRDQIAVYAPKVAAVAREAAKQAQEVIASAGEANRKVLALQARIADLQRQLGGLSADAKNALSGAATTGAGLTMTLMSFTVTAAVGTAAFPVFGLVGAFIGIGINAALEASKSQEVLHTVREIGQLSLELSAEQNQAAAMRSIAQALERLGDQAGSANLNMAGVLHHWDDLCGELELLRELAGQPALELGSLMPLSATRLRDAAIAWRAIIAGANKVQASAFRMAEPIEIKAVSP